MKRLLCCLLLLALCAWAYAPVADNGFVDYDDSKYLTENPVVQRGLTAEGLRWAFDNRQTGNFHPLTWLSHMLDVELFGMAPGAHHLSSLALHALAACALFLALARLGLALAPALVVALLFAVHPLRVESVAWAAERKDVLAGLFFALALLAWAGYARAGGAWRYALVAGCLLLGLSAKAMLVTLPVLLLLLDAWPLRRHREHGWRRLVLEKLPLLVLVAAFALVALATQRAVGALRTDEQLPLAARAANAVASYGTYAWKTLVPSGLAVFHPHPAIVAPDEPPWNARVLAVLAALLAVSAGAWALRLRAPAVLVGWLWYGVSLLPVVGLVQVGEQAWADRYAYLPTIGLFLAVVPPLADLARGRARPLLGVLTLALVLASGLATRRQVAHWRDTRALFEHARRVTAKNYVAEIGLALVHEREGRHEAAAQAYRRALAMNPRSERAHNNLGALLQRLGRGDEARQHLEQALAIQPDWPEAWNNLGIWYAQRGRTDEALEAFARALRTRPDYGEAQRNRGGVLEAAGRLDEALAAYEAAARSLGEDARLLEDRGRVHQARGEARRAVELYRRALEAADEAWPPRGAALNLAWILATHPDPELRDGALALRLARTSVRLTREQDARALVGLAAACAETGDFEAAVRWQARAIERAGNAGGELARQLESYRGGRPWRDG